MEFRIIFSPVNRYPLRGLLIKGSSVYSWLRAIENLRLRLSDVCIYAMPGSVANTIGGCIVTFNKDIGKEVAGRYEMLQQVSSFLFIPERADLFPEMTTAEIEKLFQKSNHVIHPDFGVVELSEEVNFLELILPPIVQPLEVVRPQATVRTPSRVRSFYVHPLSPEEVLDNLTEKVFPKHEEFNDKPLTLVEKIRLWFYGLFFKRERSNSDSGLTQETGIASRLKSMFNPEKWKGIEKDFEDLNKRNQKQVDKLMDLLRDNPEEALKYAIPLDGEGTGRGAQTAGGRFELSRRWSDFSLFRNNGGGSGGIDLGNHFYKLQQQYNLTAEELIKRKEFEKAAFVYMKLLKQYRKAAEAMELGSHYAEAATIYLKHGNDRQSAARCYEKGNMIMEAIGQYRELGEHEKVGDLYMGLNNKSAAIQHYTEAADQMKIRNQYIKASLLYKEKMDDASSGQTVLLEGWKDNKDAINCLNFYFSSIDNDDSCGKEMHRISEDLVDDTNRENFLKVMHYQFQNRIELRDDLREMAFEMVSKQAVFNPAVVVELRNFNPQNKELVKDALRFKLKRK